MAAGVCRHCGYEPVAYDAPLCPKCAGSDPNVSPQTKLTNKCSYMGAWMGLILGGGFGLIAGGVMGALFLGVFLSVIGSIAGLIVAKVLGSLGA